MKQSRTNKVAKVIRQTGKIHTIFCPQLRGCGYGWTCDRCPNYGCPANERN